MQLKYTQLRGNVRDDFFFRAHYDFGTKIKNLDDD